MPFPNAYVSVLAGSGPNGFVDGTGAAAQFNSLIGISTDAAGNVYVADEMNNAIRKISPQGVVTTLAGSGSATYADGTGRAAAFNDPHGVAVDPSGNVFVADTYNNRIRKITPTGVVTTLAGSSAGDSDGVGAAAQFGYPRGIAVDASGNLIVADSYNNKIRKVTPAGVVSTLAGGSASDYGNADGVGSAARFSFPTSVAVDSAGNAYVADLYNNRIRKVTPAGVVSTLAGGTIPGDSDGQGSGALFSSPYGVAATADGTVYVADSTNNSIRRITPDGSVSTLAGQGPTGWGVANGTGDVAQFNQPHGVTVDPAGNLYVADTNRIRKVALSNMAKSSGDGQTAVLGTALANPLVVVVTDGSGNPVDNAAVTFAIVMGNGSLSRTSAVTGADGTASTILTVGTVPGVYRVTAATSVLRNPVVTFAAVGQRAVTVSTFAGSDTGGNRDGTGAAAQFARASGIAIDTAGNLYVADYDNHTIRKITPDAAVSTLAGSGTAGTADGTGTAAQFTGPAGVAVDSAGNVYVADAPANQIRKISSTGVVTNFASMLWPHSLAMDGAGNLYAACHYNILQKYQSTGGGTPIGSFPSSASFSGIAVDSANNVYVTDSDHGIVRKVSSAGVTSVLEGPPLTGGAPAPLSFNRPRSLVVTSTGTIFVATIGTGILEVSPAGLVTTLIASAAVSQMVLDSSGAIFATDSTGHKVLKITIS